MADVYFPNTLAMMTPSEATRYILARAHQRTIELLRHMMNWAVGRVYIDGTPFGCGTERAATLLAADYPLSGAKCRFANARPDPDFR